MRKIVMFLIPLAFYTATISCSNSNDTNVYSPVVIGYLPLGDHEYETCFDDIQWKHLTHVNVCFARACADGSLDVSEVTARIGKTRDVAHGKNVKILISIAKKAPGAFVKAIENESTRRKLVKQIIDFTRENQLDGFDIDYEEYDNWTKNFPNLLEFAKELNRAKGSNMLMTCAVVSKWLSYGTEWHQYFDYINLMSYDYEALQSNTPKQHASYARYMEDIQYWEDIAKAPKHKIVAGLPFYGYSWDDIPGVDESRGIRFHSILSTFQNVKDIADKDYHSQTLYNGRNTIRQKCRYVIDNEYGGVMIWQLFQDAYAEKDKLIKVVGETMQAKD